MNSSQQCAPPSTSPGKADLWPADLLMGEPVQTPVGLLRAQARYLTARTDGTLYGEVSTTADGDDGFKHTLTVCAPSVSETAYPLCTLQHDVSLYPVEIYADRGRHPVTRITDAQSLADVLAIVLAGPEIRNLIQCLLLMHRDTTN